MNVFDKFMQDVNYIWNFDPDNYPDFSDYQDPEIKDFVNRAMNIDTLPEEIKNKILDLELAVIAAKNNLGMNLFDVYKDAVLDKNRQSARTVHKFIKVYIPLQSIPKVREIMIEMDLNFDTSDIHFDTNFPQLTYDLILDATVDSLRIHLDTYCRNPDNYEELGVNIDSYDGIIQDLIMAQKYDMIAFLAINDIMVIQWSSYYIFGLYDITEEYTEKLTGGDYSDAIEILNRIPFDNLDLDTIGQTFIELVEEFEANMEENPEEKINNAVRIIAEVYDKEEREIRDRMGM